MPTEEETNQRVAEAVEAERERERTARLNVVSIKLPQFWPDKTRFWFAQAEAQFHTKGITNEKTKFSHVVTMLDSKTATQAMDVIEVPDTVEPYTVLKRPLTKAYTLTDSEKAARIIDMTGLGDRTPSQCLADMLQLVPQGQAADPGFLFREHFLRQLPQEVRTQLVQTTKTATTAENLRELAEEADRYFLSNGSRISAVASPSNILVSSASTDPDPVSVGSTEADVFAISGRGGSGPRGSHQSSGSRGRGGARQGFRPSKTFTFCYYHAKFGDKAQNCVEPCQFQSVKQPGNGQPGRRSAN